ncbi:hypothetical protein DPMN_052764 [Dreissena polymorpha]|uniref:Uncharacterized protein n=1 Tax=Dreissena polymorpha TaxID=45954 RepID=A0A9D4CK87_DREPO|nr:hypothetical protein DPMN_052764 [Dreissena polymorpha]
MVDSQTSPMSSPTDNTSRRNSFSGDSFIKSRIRQQQVPHIGKYISASWRIWLLRY